MGKFVFGYNQNRMGFIHSFIQEIPGYRRIAEKHEVECRTLIRSIPDGRNGQKEHFAIFLPIVNEKWAAKDINGITSGALVCFASKAIIYDFSKMKAHTIPYEQISDVSSKNNQITVKLRNNAVWKIKVNVNIGGQVAKSFFGILAGITSGGSATDRWATHQMTKGFIEDSNNEAKIMIEYVTRLHAFFLGAMPHDEDENQGTI
jgi:hypothetical protein